jgi:putative redox protein
VPTELVIHADNDRGMHVTAGDGAHSITMDYPLPGDTDPPAGLTPLRTLLASLAACSATSLSMLLRKRDQPLEHVEVTARGQRRDEHPTIITAIDLEFTVHGKGIDPEVVAHALTLSEERICPVWAMLKVGTPITASFRIVED